jgi:hypothetical protein
VALVVEGSCEGGGELPLRTKAVFEVAVLRGGGEVEQVDDVADVSLVRVM